MNLFMIPIILGIFTVILAVILSTINWWRVTHINTGNLHEKKALMKILKTIERTPPAEYIGFAMIQGVLMLGLSFLYPQLRFLSYFGISFFIFSFSLILSKVFHSHLIHIMSNAITK